MSSATYANPYVVAADAAPSDRAAFIRSTYLHLGFAILAFGVIEWWLLQQAWVEPLVARMTNGMMWLVVLGAFMVVSWIADAMARSSTSKGAQYVGLGIYVVAEAVIFLPLLWIAMQVAGDASLILKAGMITGFLFGGLTFTAFVTRKDFSFFRGFLMIGGFVALGIIVASLLFGFDLGLIFSGAMAIFASIAILYTTSNIIHHYHTDQAVAASISLFAAVALLFWYILRILISLAASE